MRLGYILRATARVIKDTSSTSRLRPGGLSGRAAITLTAPAINRIKQLLAEQPEMTALKVGFRSFYLTFLCLDWRKRARM
jgi:hypothetical protein